MVRAGFYSSGKCSTSLVRPTSWRAASNLNSQGALKKCENQRAEKAEKATKGCDWIKKGLMLVKALYRADGDGVHP